MKNLINRVEKVLIRLVVFTVLIITVVQGFMTVDPVRFYLSWSERLEGQTIQIPVAGHREYIPVAEEVSWAQARLAIEAGKFTALPKARILVNGEAKYDFREKKVIIDINAGDTVEIDSTAYNFPIEYEIVEVSSNLAYPERKQTFTANQTMVMVGKIIVK